MSVPSAQADLQSPASRPVGRPPKVDRATIADAVLEVGLSRATMATVANHLGISVPGLYYHVRNRKELLLLAAERTLAAVELPEDRGQHWTEWLREWARYSRQALADEPEVFRQYLEGALATERVVEVADSVIRVLARHGFTPREALAAWAAVGSVAVGAAAQSVGQSAATAAGRSPAAEWHRILAARGVRTEAFGMEFDLEASFEDELTTMLIGLAARRGESWEHLGR